jgi:hypothetical protein
VTSADPSHGDDHHGLPGLLGSSDGLQQLQFAIRLERGGSTSLVDGKKKTSGPKIFDVFKGWGIVEWWIFRDFSTFRYMFGRPVAFPGCLEMEDLSQKMLCLWGISLILGSLFSNKAFEASSKLVTKLNIAGTHQVARSLCWCFHVGVRGWEESG